MKILKTLFSNKQGTLNNGFTDQDGNNQQHIINKKIILTHFDNISLSSFVDVVIKKTDDPEKESLAELSCDANCSDTFSIKVDNNTLNIETKVNKSLHNAKATLILYKKYIDNISTFSLGNIDVLCPVTKRINNFGVGNVICEYFIGKSIEATSLGNICIKDCQSDKLSIQSTGTGNIIISDGAINKLKNVLLSLGNISINANVYNSKTLHSGNGDCFISDNLHKLDVQLTSLGSFKAGGACNQSVHIEHNGVGNCEILDVLTKELYIDCNSPGNVFISGKAEHVETHGNNYAINLNQVNRENIFKNNTFPKNPFKKQRHKPF